MSFTTRGTSSFDIVGLELIKFYRENPIVAAEDLLDVKLDIPQALVLEDMWFKPYVIVTAGRGTGKSFLLSVVACLKGLLYSGDKVGIISSSFRQAKNTFLEVKRRWEESQILREAVEKRPTFGADRCYLEFRSPKTKQSSIVEALPIGDGSKIRGSRFYCLLIDEYAQVPSEILDMVIKPMAATAANPMERVVRKRKLRELREAGFLQEAEELDLYDSGTVNKLIGTTSAFYKFNHVYDKILRFQEEIKKGSKKHALHNVSYKDMSEGFLDESNIKEAKSSMPEHIFEMEYEAIWRGDSDGLFKASLIESAKTLNCKIKTVGDVGKSYILGVDPARSSDSFAICILEVGLDTPSKLVYAFASKNNKFPEMADAIHSLSLLFNFTGFIMDAGAGGGGMALKDLLADHKNYGDTAILDMDDPEYMEVKGKKILRMFNPSSKTNADAAYTTLRMLEQKSLLLPASPTLGNDDEDLVYETIYQLYQQMVSIVISETRSGVAHFDVAGGGHGKEKKDLYSAFSMACLMLYQMTKVEIDTSSIFDTSGIVTPINRGCSYA